MGALIARPKRSFFEYFVFIIGAAFYGSCVAAPLIIAHDVLNPTSLTQSARYWYLLFGFIVACIGMGLWLMHHTERYTWRLDDDTLVRGNRKKTEIPLSSIDRLIIGLPPRAQSTHNLLRKLVPGPSHLLDSSFRATLVIKLNSGAFMPLNIHACEGGSELMNQLLQIMQDKVDEDYSFSSKEATLLSRPRWNTVMEPRN